MVFRVGLFWAGFLIAACSLHAGQQQTYTANDPRIQKIPVSLDGICLVSSNEAGERVPGKPEFQFLYGSHRYYFASMDKLLQFKDAEDKKQQVPALCGMCPVATYEQKEKVPGEPAFAVEFDGRRYWCASEEARKKFAANPFKYAPVFGGDCSYCYVLEKARVEGSWFFSKTINDRLYLFPDQQTLDHFVNSPEQQRFIDMDLIRTDVVEKKENRSAQGTGEYTHTLGGFTYFFISKENRDRFIADPAAFLQ
jgi:YHS domain-containing protein